MDQPHVFELVGGHPALDFLNTIHDWTVDTPRDYIASYADAVRFGEAAGILTRSEARRLARLGGEAELARLHALRALLERIFRSRVEARPPRAGDLRDISAAVVESARGSRLRAGDGAQLRREIPMSAAGPALLRLRIIDAALPLLTSDEIVRVKGCPRCGWFFVDRSKNGSRRWCSMSSCGASAKSKTYYRRTRSAG
jgi:predicted RNA-binding Zn ribbon-like protein